MARCAGRIWAGSRSHYSRNSRPRYSCTMPEKSWPSPMILPSASITRAYPSVSTRYVRPSNVYVPGGFHGGSRYFDCPAGLDASTSSSPGRPGFTRQPGRVSHEWVIPPARQGSSTHLVSLDQVMRFTGLEVLNDGAHEISHRSDERVREIARPRFLTPRPSDDETPVDNGSLSAKCLSGMHESVSE